MRSDNVDRAKELSIWNVRLWTMSTTLPKKSYIRQQSVQHMILTRHIFWVTRACTHTRVCKRKIGEVQSIMAHLDSRLPLASVIDAHEILFSQRFRSPQAQERSSPCKRPVGCPSRDSTTLQYIRVGRGGFFFLSIFLLSYELIFFGHREGVSTVCCGGCNFKGSCFGPEREELKIRDI